MIRKIKMNMKIVTAFTAVTLVLSVCVAKGQSTLAFPENMEVEGIPAIDARVAADVRPYTESRTAAFANWHPTSGEMIVTTRFGNTNQLHLVKSPMSARKQLTFFEEPVRNASFQPVTGKYFIFTRDIGGNEFGQLFRYDMETGKSTMLTDGGKSQNGNVTWNKAGTRFLFTSTKRNGTDRDIYIMDPLDTSTTKLLAKLEGGGWAISDWSDDGKKVLIRKFVSANESSVWIFDMNSSALEKILPVSEERVIYDGLEFSSDGRSIFVLTNKAGEFERPARVDLATKKIEYLVSDINWEVSQYELSDDQKTAAFTTNEAGEAKLYIQDIASKKYNRVTALPTGLIGAIKWTKDGSSLALSFGTARTGGDVYVWNNASRKLIRWTESELGGMNLADLPLPELVKWRSFDGLEISGFLYRAPARFAGKQPVIINIHGGPEGQSFPGFVGRLNYLLNELGVSIIFPNVRGSSGFGKTFLDMDNGIKREESVKDIGALLDWIGKQPFLDSSRIMVTGGSYGGYMTLASAFHYNDRIRCALDVVGISHFTTFLKNTENYRRDLRRVEYGDEREPAIAAFFEKIAPLNNAHKITKPMFIVQGKNDPRVPHTEARQMADKIKSNGGVVWFMMANDEGHGFAKKNNQDIQFYATVAFIKKYLL